MLKKKCLIQPRSLSFTCNFIIFFILRNGLYQISLLGNQTGMFLWLFFRKHIISNDNLPVSATLFFDFFFLLLRN